MFCRVVLQLRNLPLWIKLTFHHHKDCNKKIHDVESPSIEDYTGTHLRVLYACEDEYCYLIFWYLQVTQQHFHYIPFALRSCWVIPYEYQNESLRCPIFGLLSTSTFIETVICNQCNQFFVIPLLPTYNYRSPIIFYLTDCVS